MVSMSRVACLGFGLVMGACGGESSRTTQGQRTTDEDSALSGDYWIATPDQSYFVTVESATRALVGPEYGGPLGYTIEHHPGATLAWKTISERPGIEITGEYVLRSTAENDLAATTYAFDLATSRALVASGQWLCHGSNPVWNVAEGSAVEDTTPTEVKAFGDGVVEPWGYVGFMSERPVEAPLTPALELKVDGSPVSIAWGDAPSGLGSVLSGTIDDWPSLLGKTLELSGFVTASNGIVSPVLATQQVLDYGRHTGLVDFRSSLPADVTAWGVVHQSPGVISTCPDGCVYIGAGSGMGLRFQSPGPLLRVTSTSQGLGVALMWVGGTPTHMALQQGDGSALVTTDIPVPAISGDLFVLIRGPSPPEGYFCTQTTTGSAYLASVESTAG